MSDQESQISQDEDSLESEESQVEDPSAEALPVESDPEWPTLLQYLLDERGFDFHGYKAASLSRRIRKRMDAVGLERFSAYQDYLQAHPGEFATLFNTILINVTSFFRDPAAWEAVRTRALPDILAGKSPEEPLRAWSAGCASGEEAYTIAMVLAEELGLDEFQRRVKIYATDVDDDALNAARHATYGARHVEGVPPELLAKYFDHADGNYTFRRTFAGKSSSAGTT
jgi:two-component system CheB/CheR fusion protein